MKLSVAVMAHPARSDLVGDLLERLDIDADCVVWDRDEDRWDTGTRAWEHHDPDADWHLVIQDDALPCRDLLDGLAEALDELPGTSVASLYADGKRAWMQTGQRHDHMRRRWIQHRTLVWGLAMAAPVTTIAAMLDYCDENPQPNYDARIAAYYRRLGWSAYFTWPSLVEHKPVKSLIGHSDGRHATKFIGADASAIEWARTHPRERKSHGQASHR